MRSGALAAQLIFFGAVVAAAALLPIFGTSYAIGVGLTFAMWIALAQSWVVFSGLSGYVSLGHVVFYGIGASAVAFSWGSVSLPVGAAIGAAVAIVLAVLVGGPCLRVKGPYFVMLTFGISEFVKYVVIAIEAKTGSGSRMLLGAPDLEVLYWAMLALAVSLPDDLAHRSQSSGAALRAIREDEVAAETIGIDVARYKISAFALSSLVPALVGGVMVARGGYYEAHPAFDPLISLTLICIAVVGGSDSPLGPLVGALLLIGLRELLWNRFPYLYMILVGAVLILFVLLAPEGVVGKIKEAIRRRRRKKAGAGSSVTEAARGPA